MRVKMAMRNEELDLFRFAGSRLRVIIPCPTCSRIAFCSRRCRQQAMQNYHSIECCIIDYLYSASISITCYLALRMITIKPLQFYLDVKPFLPDQDPLQVAIIFHRPKQDLILSRPV